MTYEPSFVWDEENRSAICTLSNGKNTFFGHATCHPDDEDMMSEKTGCEIAFRRARIKYLQHTKNMLAERLAALTHYYNTINHSKYFNENSYENKMLQRQLHLIKNDLATTKEMIAMERESLKTLIDEKDLFYKAIRKRRQNRTRSENNN